MRVLRALAVVPVLAIVVTAVGLYFNTKLTTAEAQPSSTPEPTASSLSKVDKHDEQLAYFSTTHIHPAVQLPPVDPHSIGASNLHQRPYDPPILGNLKVREKSHGWNKGVVVCPNADAYATYNNLDMAFLMKANSLANNPNGDEDTIGQWLIDGSEISLARSGCSLFPAGTSMYASGLEGSLLIVTIKNGEGRGMVGVTRMSKDDYDHDLDADAHFPVERAGADEERR